MSDYRIPTMTGVPFVRRIQYLYERARQRPATDRRTPTRGPMRRTAHNVTMIISGGQTGVDRAALHVARTHGIPYGGWIPAGGWAEDRTAAPGLLGEFPLLRPTCTTDPAERTELNVRDSDATLIVAPHNLHSPGTELTAALALRHGKPCRVTHGSDPREVARWLAAIGPDVRLNVAGPRASEWAEGYETCRALLNDVLASVAL